MTATSARQALPPLPAGEIPDWLNYRQAGDAFPSLGSRFIRKLVHERRLPAYKPTGPSGRTLVAREDIENFIRASRQDAIGAV